MFPENLNADYYQQFPDPLRAYWNLPALYKYYKENKAAEYPDSEIPHINYAWKLAQEEM